MDIKKQYKEYMVHLIRSVVFWTSALSFFAFFRYYGLSEEIGLSIQEDLYHIYDLDNILIGYACAGILIGTFHASIEFFIDKFLSRYLPIGLIIVIYVVSVLFIVVTSSEIVLRFFSGILKVQFDIGQGWWYRDDTFRSLLIYISVASFVFSLFVIMYDKSGYKVFFKMLVGYYRNPKEEDRIFMFLDMKDSTAIAEKIGHKRYSKLIQDCFYDLNEITPLFSAEIYQYIGDEVVISWPFIKGIKDIRFVDLYFSFREKLKSRSAHYIQEYGLVPIFKAGAHGGKVTVAEIGVVKKELAFHGDVVNTAARIQGKCNHYGASLLISRKLVAHMERIKDISMTSVGKVSLKGKKKEIEIYSIDEQTVQPLFKRALHTKESHQFVNFNLRQIL